MSPSATTSAMLSLSVTLAINICLIESAEKNMSQKNYFFILLYSPKGSRNILFDPDIHADSFNPYLTNLEQLIKNSMNLVLIKNSPSVLRPWDQLLLQSFGLFSKPKKFPTCFHMFFFGANWAINLFLSDSRPVFILFLVSYLESWFRFTPPMATKRPGVLNRCHSKQLHRQRRVWTI